MRFHSCFQVVYLGFKGFCRGVLVYVGFIGFLSIGFQIFILVSHGPGFANLGFTLNL